MRALIVEDELYNFRWMRDRLLEEYPRAEIDGPVTNLADLERALTDQSRYDVIFCDIRLEDGVCFSVFDGVELTVPVVFTTAYSEYALNAFDANGIAYLLKPVDAASLRKATEKALAMKRSRPDLTAVLESLGLKGSPSYLHYLKASAYDGSYIIETADVSYFTVSDKFSLAMMPDGSGHRIGYTLDGLMQRLDPMQFFRANRQYIVSRHAIRRIQAYGHRQVLLKLAGYDDTLILVSKERLSALNDWIEQ